MICLAKNGFSLPNGWYASPSMDSLRQMADDYWWLLMTDDYWWLMTVRYISIYTCVSGCFIYIYICIYSIQSSVISSHQQSSVISSYQSSVVISHRPFGGEIPYLARHIILAERIRSWRGISSIWQRESFFGEAYHPFGSTKKVKLLT